MSVEPQPSVFCPACKAGNVSGAFRKRGFDFLRCASCGFIFVHPLPENTAEIYDRSYFTGATHGFGYMNYDEDKVAMQPFFRRVLDGIERFCPRRGIMLDVGAATGFFMKLACRRGWKASGVEVSEYAFREAERSGLDVRWETLESAGFPGGSFDAVTLLDVLEHVGDLDKMVAGCWRLLRPGGIIFINTPDTDSLWARAFGRRWHSFLPPEHLSYFNRKNLGLLLETHGFRVIATGKISKSFTPAYVFSILFRWQKFRLWHWLAQRLERSAVNRVVIPLDIRDNFFVIARKDDTVAQSRVNHDVQSVSI